MNAKVLSIIKENKLVFSVTTEERTISSQVTSTNDFGQAITGNIDGVNYLELIKYGYIYLEKSNVEKSIEVSSISYPLQYSDNNELIFNTTEDERTSIINYLKANYNSEIFTTDQEWVCNEDGKYILENTGTFRIYNFSSPLTYLACTDKSFIAMGDEITIEDTSYSVIMISDNGIYVSASKDDLSSDITSFTYNQLSFGRDDIRNIECSDIEYQVENDIYEYTYNGNLSDLTTEVEYTITPYISIYDTDGTLICTDYGNSIDKIVPHKDITFYDFGVSQNGTNYYITIKVKGITLDNSDDFKCTINGGEAQPCECSYNSLKFYYSSYQKNVSLQIQFEVEEVLSDIYEYYIDGDSVNTIQETDDKLKDVNDTDYYWFTYNADDKVFEYYGESKITRNMSNVSQLVLYGLLASKCSDPNDLSTENITELNELLTSAN